jgi:hypothetical protein
MAYALQISVVKKTADGHRNFTTHVVTDEVSTQVDTAMTLFGAEELHLEPIDITRGLVDLFGAPDFTARLARRATFYDLAPHVAQNLACLRRELNLKAGDVECAFASLA